MGNVNGVHANMAANSNAQNKVIAALAVHFLLRQRVSKAVEKKLLVKVVDIKRETMNKWLTVIWTWLVSSKLAAIRATTCHEDD
jgi:hypothetical protein